MLCLAAAGAATHAAPVGFAESTMVMGEVSKDFSEVAAIYSFTRSDALALGWEETKFKPLGQRRQSLRLTELHYNRLLKRWNGEASQANLYVLLGVGQASGNAMAARTGSASSQTVFLPGVQLDFETRRVYLAAKAHGAMGLSKPSGGKKLNINRRSVSAGFSFYATEYDEWQPWLVAELKRSSLGSGPEGTLYLRGIHKTLFIEAGVGFLKANRGDVGVNFRYTF